MKKIFTLSILALSMFQNANATVRTVSNNVNSPGQYTTLQAAFDASAPNDTVYVHASETSYPNGTLRKPLVIIGEGSLPNEQLLIRTTIDYLFFTHTLSPSTINSSGSKIYGINLASCYVESDVSNLPIGSLTFERCRLASFTLSSINSNHNNLLFNQCIIGNFNSGMAGLSNTIISNSIINGMSVSNSIGSNNLMRNCLFGGTGFIGRGFLISNNIFYNPTMTFSNNTTNSSYTNNLLYYQSNPTITNGTTTATGNVFADPMFITPVMPSTVLGYNYNSTGTFANFNLQAGSPAMTLGTDGTQAGLYGGTTPWIDGTDGGVFRYYTMPKQVPFVIDMNILNNSIPVNGTLNVQINARTQD